MAGLYIHIPFCKSKCAYCDFPSVAGREEDAGRFFAAVIKEAEMWHSYISKLGVGAVHEPPAENTGQSAKDGRVLRPAPTIFSTVFLGGGTPSLLPAGELERLMGRLRGILNIQPIEFTVEANPGTVDKAKLESFRRMGADRISFGVQAAQDNLLRRIGRIHTWADFVRSYELAREAGFTNVSADMMTGLPGQTVAEAEDTARKLAAMGVEHVSCYGLILEEGTPMHAAVESGALSVPTGDLEREMFHGAKQVFAAAGLNRYEISNFAKPGFECLHNLNYWRNGDWLGLGPGAASHFSGWRRENRPDLDGYLDALERGVPPPAEEHTIRAEEAVFETVMLETRLVQGIDFVRFGARHGFAFMDRYAKQAEQLIAQGLMRKTPSGVALTERGMDVQNTVLMEFI